MFSRTKQILKISFFQNVLQPRRNQTTNTAALENFLQQFIESPPKQGYSLLFFNEEVQMILKKLTNIDMRKVFMPKPRGKELSAPVYKFLTNEELKEEMERAEKKMMYLLQIPPLVNVIHTKPETIDSDASLDGHDEHHSKYVFVDISANKTNEERIVVVREPDGLLRTGSKSEKSRLNQVYNPIEGREMETPQMFFPEHLIDVIKRKEYEFILDRACVQFEPEDEEYHQIISVTYNAINYCKDFEKLQSTRHYGSLAFYLVTHKNIDSMLCFHIERDGIDNAFSLVKLYHMVHPKCKSAELSVGKSELEVVKQFIESDSNDKETLEKALKNYLTKVEENRKVESGLG